MGCSECAGKPASSPHMLTVKEGRVEEDWCNERLFSTFFLCGRRLLECFMMSILHENAMSEIEIQSRPILETSIITVGFYLYLWDPNLIYHNGNLIQILHPNWRINVFKPHAIIP